MNKNFILKETLTFPEYGTLYLYEHIQTGATIAYLNAADDNKVFSIGFKTLPDDNTGVAHILEHSVLCGSRKYNIPDPFAEMNKRSMNTYLNAITYCDMTRYPVASKNEQDFRNLMDIYLDAVFYPNIYKHSEIFKQEGWHYHLENREQEPTIQGVVYNEMKGAYAGKDRFLYIKAKELMFPDTSLKNDSGGTPEAIPTLTYENFIAFHKQYYHPSNSFIYLYGTLDIDFYLEYLHQDFLSAFEKRTDFSNHKAQSKFETRKCFEFPISGKEGEVDLVYAWVKNYESHEDFLATSLLIEALMNDNGGLIKEALREISNEVDYDVAEYNQIFTMISAKSVKVENKEKFFKIIESAFKTVQEKGLDQEFINSFIDAKLFKGKFAMVLNQERGLHIGSVLTALWNHKRSFKNLSNVEVYEGLKTKHDLLKAIAQHDFLENTHAAKMTFINQSLVMQDSNQLIIDKDLALNETALLKAYQQRDTSEYLKDMPVLSINDLSQTCPYPTVNLLDYKARHYLVSNKATNGAIGVLFTYALDDFEDEDVPYLSLIENFLSELGTSTINRQEAKIIKNRYFGVFRAGAKNLTACDKLKHVFQIQALTSKEHFNQMIQFLGDFLTDLNFEADEVFKLMQAINEYSKSELVNGGHNTGIVRSAAATTPFFAFLDDLEGLGFSTFLQDVVNNWAQCGPKFMAKLKAVYEKLQNRNRIFCSLLCEESDTAFAQESLDTLFNRLPASILKQEYIHGLKAKSNDVLVSNQTNVNYVSLSFGYDKMAYKGMPVITRLLSKGYLWDTVRVQNGAYGGFSGARGDIIYFSSYRDPHINKSLQIYKNAAQYLRNLNIDQADLDNIIISTASALDGLSTEMSNLMLATTYHLLGVSNDEVQDIYKHILGLKVEDLKTYAEVFESASQSAVSFVVTNETLLENENLAFENKFDFD